MKTSEFKKIIKESVREAIKEELRDILLEAIKSPKETKVVKEVIKENQTHQPIPNPGEMRQKYMDILGNMAAGKDELNFNTNNLMSLKGPVDTTSEGSSLPNGEVSLDMVFGLMKGK